MCYAILTVKHRVGESSTIRCETAEELVERTDRLRANEETLEFRVYLAQPKQVRTTTWETQP